MPDFTDTSWASDRYDSLPILTASSLLVCARGVAKYRSVKGLKGLLTFMWRQSFLSQSFLVGSMSSLYLCSSATWRPNGTTFLNFSSTGTDPSAISIALSDTIFVTAIGVNNTQLWRGASPSTISNATDLSKNQSGIFVSTQGDVYVDTGDVNGTVSKISNAGTNTTTFMQVNGSCYSLFVDRNDTLYCSLGTLHQVVRHSLNSSGLIPTVVAGNGTPGSGPSNLNTPWGVVVDSNVVVSVADCGNNRIQQFRVSQVNGTTFMQTLSTGSIVLSCPAGIALDAFGNLFITDRNNHRIIGGLLNRFRCIVGCSGLAGPAADQLSLPQSVSFDSVGSLYVVDRNNDRIQKFDLGVNTCGRCMVEKKAIKIEKYSLSFEATILISS